MYGMNIIRILLFVTIFFVIAKAEVTKYKIIYDETIVIGSDEMIFADALIDVKVNKKSTMKKDEFLYIIYHNGDSCRVIIREQLK